ncbi:MAG: pyridoxamine 5'-phosphate oxidase family protein [Novosphingobium sp.]|nr:pyridoxamine 5'-phosphate oxidase family protein [Novosphingobium sp.]
MSFIDELPEEVARLIRSGMVAEYATVTGNGVPIDTPTYYFPSADESSLDIGTGLAYPAKAERARRNPKVGMLIERAPEEPVISIAGYGAVQDADMQANLDRYVSETAHMLPPGGAWEAMRRSIFYWTRMYIAVTPAVIRWWPNQKTAQSDAPQIWRAPENTVFPPSDPAPPGKMSKPPAWPLLPWWEIVEETLERGSPGHLTICDEEGFPLPLRVHDIKPSDEGFDMQVPASAPWSHGQATLSFLGREVFVGDASSSPESTFLKVERAMPIFPLTSPDGSVPRPDRETRHLLVARMEEELARRGQPVPVVPEDMLPPTRHSLLRIEALKAKMTTSGHVQS